MRRMSTEELRLLEVINLCGGERLGFPCEFEIDVDENRIISFTVTTSKHPFAFIKSSNDITIPWRRIECIGEDAILVRIPESEFDSCDVKNRKKRKK